MPTLEIPGKIKPYLMAHRGNSTHCPENTLAAFRRALDEGADILETDLHLTADGEFVCIHDATVDRTTNGSGTVADMTLEQIQALSASYGRADFENERIPTLGEVIALIPDNVVLTPELKTDRFRDPDVCRRLVNQLDAGGIRARVAMLSFSMARLQAMQQIAPDIPTGFITLKNPLPTPGANFLGPLWPLLALNPFYVRWAHRLGKIVCPLDIHPDTRVRFYRRLGCDAIMTNDPGMTARVLRRS